jgi:hypothetical protein
MKNVRSILFALTVLLMATAAQAQETRVQARIPFDFVVGNHAYPAGEYSLASITEGGAVIRIDNTQEAAVHNVQLSIPVTNLKPSETTKLVFLRMGDNYFLSQVWITGRVSGREFPMGRSYTQLAQNHEKSDTVIVAANFSPTK